MMPSDVLTLLVPGENAPGAIPRTVYKFVVGQASTRPASPTVRTNSSSGGRSASATPESICITTAALASRVQQKTGSLPRSLVRISGSALSPRAGGGSGVVSPPLASPGPLPSPSAAALSGGGASAGSPSELASPQGGSPLDSQPPSPARQVAPCAFAPVTYVMPWDARTVNLTLKRAAAGPLLTVFVSTTDDSTAIAGTDFSPIVATPVTFEAGRTATTLTFKWGPGKNWTAPPATSASVIKISFALSLTPGGAVPDAPVDVAGDTTAVLLLVPPEAVSLLTASHTPAASQPTSPLSPTLYAGRHDWAVNRARVA